MFVFARLHGLLIILFASYSHHLLPQDICFAVMATTEADIKNIKRVHHLNNYHVTDIVMWVLPMFNVITSIVVT